MQDSNPTNSAAVHQHVPRTRSSLSIKLPRELCPNLHSCNISPSNMPGRGLLQPQVEGLNQSTKRCSYHRNHAAFLLAGAPNDTSLQTRAAPCLKAFAPSCLPHSFTSIALLLVLELATELDRGSLAILPNSDLHVSLITNGSLRLERILEAAANNLGANVGVAQVRDSSLAPLLQWYFSQYSDSTG